MTNKRVALTTAGSHEEAQRIARALVEQRLAACVNIVAPVESIYAWKGAVESAAEWLLLIKTTAEAFPRLRARLTELHSYETPECICITIEDGAEEYLNWIGDSVE
jgi:periplasmic divalent cation tolerance protein